MSDNFQQDGLTASARNFFAITPADTDLATIPKALFIGGAGTVIATPASGGAAVTFNVLAGAILPIRARRVALASTATGIVGLA
ncbi:hypothetical protein [Sediminicoccus sp. KRV36]|uniref:spike base protein, RCAP_Rcc01079 family n=1 Tax=Sediminicoccus sp. KRV36 TaxID=3133721 RepID=UPI00200C4534|nr:hypothetical protein [Sediminicoccus rosea]UPY35504.1 hypothetical protein LHU95_14895 [Sediminicoccus rosea]